VNLQRYLPRAQPEPLADLVLLALDLRWSWSHEADHLWRAIDARLWEATRNPWSVLEAASASRLDQLATDTAFAEELRRLVERREQYLRQSSWFDQAIGTDRLGTVAYFSMEFGLSEALPLYSGGLGVLAGDLLKTASDLGVPVVGVGLLFQQGYFRQSLDARGDQIASYPYNPPTMLPVLPVRAADGGWTRVPVELPGRTVQLRAWQVQVGRGRLLLLDSNDPMNAPGDRGITAELYAAGVELRLQQEIVLGIGGWLLLEALAIEVDVCHINEGHAAFAPLARALGWRKRTGCSLAAARWCTRAGNVFTTHTSVEAGFDRFAPDLFQQYLEPYCQGLDASADDLLGLGRTNADDPREPFNMATFAIRSSAQVNAVSALHARVTRRMLQPLFPRWPRDEIPVSHVTNGVHMPSWDSAAADELWTRACGKERWLVATEEHDRLLRCCPDADLWKMRGSARRALVTWVRRRLGRQRATRGEQAAARNASQHVLDPDALMLGFARRFATYKRPTLLLHDQERLTRILTSRERPVQLIISGKAHPEDVEGARLVRLWADYIRDPAVSDRVIFVEDYDMDVAAELVQGVDLWLNTPRRPWEASGTSGMKVLVNGGLNLSQLDGWWSEAYSPGVGWALGDGEEHEDTTAWDAADAQHLYRLLEEEIVPCFYRRDPEGIPVDWVARVRESMATLTPRFSSNRMLREYAEHLYVPRARAFRARAAEMGKLAGELSAWSETLERGWGAVRFGSLSVDEEEGHHRFEVEVYLADVPSDWVKVELWADPVPGEAGTRFAMAREPLVGATNGFLYRARVPATRPSADFTPRILPDHPAVVVPLEARQILWQR
jgi:starch phosphorylase